MTSLTIEESFKRKKKNPKSLTDVNDAYIFRRAVFPYTSNHHSSIYSSVKTVTEYTTITYNNTRIDPLKDWDKPNVKELSSVPSQKVSFT